MKPSVDQTVRALAIGVLAAACAAPQSAPPQSLRAADTSRPLPAPCPLPLAMNDTLRATIYATVVDVRGASVAVRAFRETTVQEALRHWRAPERAAVTLSPNVALDRNLRTGKVYALPFDAQLMVAFTPHGRVSSAIQLSAFDAPEIADAVLAAIHLADSARAFAPPPADASDADRAVRIRLLGAGPSDSVLLPLSQMPAFRLARITIPFAQAHRPALALPGHGVPTYPRALRDDGVQGEVELAFTVDATGRAIMESVRLIRATHEQFATAVRAALPRARYLPAQFGDCAVPSMTRQAFQFQLGR